MSLHWYACISTNAYCFEMHHISLEIECWALSNASLIVWIRSAVHEILADKAFTATDGLISQSFVVTFVHPVHMQIALIWGFSAQLILWKSVHWLWRYKLNEVCDTISSMQQSIYLILLHIYIKLSLLQQLRTSESFSIEAPTTLSSFGSIQVKLYSFLTQSLIKR